MAGRCLPFKPPYGQGPGSRQTAILCDKGVVVSGIISKPQDN